MYAAGEEIWKDTKKTYKIYYITVTERMRQKEIARGWEWQNKMEQEM